MDVLDLLIKTKKGVYMALPMKMKCASGTDIGKFFDIYFDIPGQDEVDAGEMPIICVSIDGNDLYDQQGNRIKDDEGYPVTENNLLEFMYNHGIASEDTDGLLTVDALQLFSMEAVDAESAEIVARWLEGMAAKIRSKFDQKKGEADQGVLTEC